MLFDIAFESILDMNDDEIDYVLESLSAEELYNLHQYAYDRLGLNVIIEEFSNMDDNEIEMVLESSNDTDLYYIDLALEAEYTEADLKDFDDVQRIQRIATRDGWDKVPKNDRDKYVSILSKTKHLIKMNQARKLGKREAVRDKMIDVASGKATKKEALANDLDSFDVRKYARYTTLTGAIAGGPMGAMIGNKGLRGAIATARAIKDHVRFEKDKKKLRSMGDKNHPDDQWQFNRAKATAKKIKDLMNTEIHLRKPKQVPKAIPANA